MTDRERIDSLVRKAFDYAAEIMELKQENSELKKRVAELEKPKKKRKFRAMTNAEFCDKWLSKHRNRCYGDHEICPLLYYSGCYTNQKPFRFVDGKYIMIEVKE
nr:MAG TPA: hypothetical protein [Caudoviricetes sp.]